MATRKQRHLASFLSCFGREDAVIKDPTPAAPPSQDTKQAAKLAEADRLLTHFHLQPHVEGGHYVEIYRSPDMIPATALPSRFTTGRNPLSASHQRHLKTSIYFLLKAGDKSHLHRLKSDETWHFYKGDPLTVVMLEEGPEGSQTGTLRKVTLGLDFEKGEVPHFTVPHGVWFGSFSSGAYSFVECTVSPGFDFEDFEMAERTEMFGKFEKAEDPEVKEMITFLTREEVPHAPTR
ncbi:hypothetical protein HDU96_003527 [Phlyctochytrium bullatum]|nr:hypothetical protein HDU96_003527 [Phlyctochytrium bullatum]